ncbi:MAG TPA: serine hydrolase domain-containing protein [Polyangia bacterium]|nr:serine hydrolase domain-containing protein [Polyangia bacterium]
MKMKFLALVIVAAVVLTAARAGADVEAFRDPDRKAKVLAALPKVEARIAAEVAARKIPGLAFGVVLDGDLVFAKGFGVADLDDKRPVDADTVFRIGSITKTFTSLAILKLRDAGKLSLDEPITRRLPELRALRYPTRDSAPITIRQLLTHTSGLPQFGNFSHAQHDHEPTERELFNDLPHVGMLWAPGTAYSYSSFGVALLGLVVKRLSGQRYRDYVSTQILAPLGMRSTYWDDRDVPKGRLATGYVAGAGGPTKIVPWRLGAMEPTGGLFTSLRDLARYASFQLAAYPPRDDPETGPVRRSSVREAHATTRLVDLWAGLHEPSAENPLLVRAWAMGIGLAWHAFKTCELEQYVGHMGSLDGYSAGIEIYPDRGFALVSLSNDHDTPHRDLIIEARDILIESKAVAPRARRASAALLRAMGALVDTYADFREDKYRKAFAKLYVDAMSPAETAHDAARVKQIHGVCKDPTPLEIRNDFSGRFSAACERGRVEYEVQIDADGRFVDVRMTSRDVPPSPAVARAAARIAGLIQRWDVAAYDAVVAFRKPTTQAMFDRVRAEHKACTVGAPLDGEGGASATLRLDCAEGGPLRLALEVDDRGERVVFMTLSPLIASKTTGRCPER